MVPDVGASNPTASCNMVVLPAPFGPTRPTTLSAGIDSVQSWRAQRRPYSCQDPSSEERQSCHTFAKALRMAVR